jgi:hypothetical protein
MLLRAAVSATAPPALGTQRSQAEVTTLSSRRISGARAAEARMTRSRWHEPARRGTSRCIEKYTGSVICFKFSSYREIQSPGSFTSHSLLAVGQAARRLVCLTFFVNQSATRVG